jgi:hypothetical protein
VDVIETADEDTFEQGLAGVGGDIPPSLGGPAFGVLIADRDADPARGCVAELEVRVGGGGAKAGEKEKRKRRPRPERKTAAQACFRACRIKWEASIIL